MDNMQLGMIINWVLFGLMTVLLVMISIDEARQEKRLREEQQKQAKKAA